MKNPALITTFALVAAFGGCAVGPDYHRPAALPNQPTPQAFVEPATGSNGVAWKIAEPSANLPRGEWWQVFNDPELNDLETLALTNNQNLVAAFSRLQQAQATLGVARSAFYPQLTLGGTPNGDINRQRTSVNEPSSGVAAGKTETYNTFTAPLYLGWEIDLWDRVRCQSQAARASFIASADDLESAKLDVAAEVADDYFALRTLDTDYDLVTNAIEAYRRSLGLTQNRRLGGIASDLDVSQAETQLHTAEAQKPDIQLRRAETLHALAIICGQSPVDFSITAEVSGNIDVPEIPVDLPSDLLEHRPDIAAAERRMAAANANVGVAEGAFFPTIRINGLAGFQSVDASSWFNWSSRLWSVGPSVELPIFTGGLNRANLAGARAAYNETVADYRQTVLSAFGEVEDELAAQRLLVEEWNADHEAAVSSQRTLEIANNRYKDGLVTYLDVATAQTDALTEERSAVEMQGARLTAAVNLIRALGCGWK